MKLLKLIPLLFSATVITSLPQQGHTLRYIDGPPSVVLGSLQQDLNGAISVGSDGVLRSLAADGSVLDYRQLDSNQHSAFFHAFKDVQLASRTSDQEHNIYEAAIFADGRSVLEEDQLLHPPAGMIPHHFHTRDMDTSFAPLNERMTTVHSVEDSHDAFSPDLACSPPVHCTDSSMCSGGCSACTFVSFFPYGICMREGKGKQGGGPPGKGKEGDH